jgi:hypothetical protein
MSENQGFKRVSTAPRSKGKFSSPNAEPLGKPIGVRLPQNLEEWLSQEANRLGTNKIDLIRTVLIEKMHGSTQQSA